MIDWELVKSELEYIAVADHMGDVNNGLPSLCRALGLSEPEWNDERGRMVFPWEREVFE